MSLIHWRDEFSLGVAAIDQEHRELIELINDLHASMGEATSADIVTGLGEIYACIAAHFALEEKYMRDTRYPALASHKQDHEALLDDLLHIMDRVEAAGDYDEIELAQQLDRWFSEHFRVHDARLHLG